MFALSIKKVWLATVFFNFALSLVTSQTASVRLPRPYSAPSSPFGSRIASPFPSDDEESKVSVLVANLCKAPDAGPSSGQSPPNSFVRPKRSCVQKNLFQTYKRKKYLPPNNVFPPTLKPGYGPGYRYTGGARHTPGLLLWRFLNWFRLMVIF